MLPIKSFIVQFTKVPLIVKSLAIISVVFLFLSWSDNDHNSFVELPVVEAVAAEKEVSEAAETEINDAVLKKKAKKLDTLIKTAKTKEKEREKVLDDLIESLNEEKRDFKLRKKELDIKEENLKTVKKEIEAKLAKMRLLQTEVTEMLNKQKAANEINITKLAKVYESAPPEQAGLLLSKIDVDIAAKILLKMNSRKAGAVWGFVDSKKAAQISKKLAKYNAGKK